MTTRALRSFLSMLVLSCSIVVARADDGKSRWNKGAPGATDREIEATLQLSDKFSKAEEWPPTESQGGGDILPPEARGPNPDFSNYLKGEITAAKRAYSGIDTTKGDLTTKYDVIIQPGHFGRVTGATGGVGKYVSEQEYAAWIAQMLLDKLAEQKIIAIAIPADGYNSGLMAKMFLALHTDAAKTPCAVGPSVAYASATDAPHMHTIALGLAISLGYDPRQFMHDNYTRNEAGYYAYKTINAPLKGLLEMGELTCHGVEEILLNGGENLARNLSTAIVFALRPASR